MFKANFSHVSGFWENLRFLGWEVTPNSSDMNTTLIIHK